MLEIHERTDTNGYEKVIATIQNENIHIVESMNGSEVNGYGIYSFDENGLRVYDFSSHELEIADGIIRTILFKGMLGGLNRCSFTVRDSEKNAQLIKLGFIEKNDGVIEDIGEFMSKCKNCNQNN